MMTQGGITKLLIERRSNLQQLGSQRRMGLDDGELLIRQRTVVVVHHRDDAILANVMIEGCLIDEVETLLRIQEDFTMMALTKRFSQQIGLIGQNALHQLLGYHRHMYGMGIGGDLGSHIQLIEVADALHFLQVLDGTGIGSKDIQIFHIRILHLLVQTMVIDGDDVPIHPLDGSTLPAVGNIRQVVQIEIVHERLQGGLKLTVVITGSTEFLLHTITVSPDSLSHRFRRRDLSHLHLHHQGTGIGELRQMRIGKIPCNNHLHQGVGKLLFQDGRISQINITDQTFLSNFRLFVQATVILLTHQLAGMG